MLPASNRGAGMNMGFPDVCNTPVGPATAPIPYPNIAMNAQAVGFSPIVKVTMVNALNMGSNIPMTSGDEAGVAHPTIKGGGMYTMGNPIVSIDRLPAINLTSMSTGNNMNNPAGAAIVPSITNVMFCRRNTTASLADELGEAMRQRSVTATELWPGSVGYLRVAACAPDLATDLLEQIRRLETQGARAVVVDLRGNPGGDLDAVIRLAAELLPSGAVIVRLTEVDGEQSAPLARGASSTMPLVLLVDRATASAAEVLAAALQHHRRALVVGERTWGKDTAWRLDSCDAKPRTAQRCRTPDGRSFERGLEPDLVAGSGQGAVRSSWAAAAHLALGLRP